MGTGPGNRHKLNSKCVINLCHTHNSFRNIVFGPPCLDPTLKTPSSYAHKGRKSLYLDLDLDLDRERDLDLERREPSLERAGERLVDFAEPRGDALLEPGRESWTDQTLR